jgi:hypothetical protein
MIKSKKLAFALIILFLIIIYYLTFNPYRTEQYLCKHVNRNMSAPISIAFYLPKKLEVHFKGKFFTADECNDQDSIHCVSEKTNIESIDYRSDTGELEHLWERYDSGEFVFDKTEIIKTKMQDFYRCD